MCNPALYIMAAAAGAKAVGARNESKAQQASLLYDAKVSENNATLAEYQAKDALYLGGVDEQSSRMATAAVKSSQRAAMAANGIDLNEGSAADVQTTTDYRGTVEANAIGDSARRSAWGYRTQGVNYQDSARNLRSGANSISPNSAAGLSLLGSAGQVASTWYGMKKAGA